MTDCQIYGLFSIQRLPASHLANMLVVRWPLCERSKQLRPIYSKAELSIPCSLAGAPVYQVGRGEGLLDAVQVWRARMVHGA